MTCSMLVTSYLGQVCTLFESLLHTLVVLMGQMVLGV